VKISWTHVQNWRVILRFLVVDAFIFFDDEDRRHPFRSILLFGFRWASKTFMSCHVFEVFFLSFLSPDFERSITCSFFTRFKWFKGRQVCLLLLYNLSLSTNNKGNRLKNLKLTDTLSVQSPTCSRTPPSWYDNVLIYNEKVIEYWKKKLLVKTKSYRGIGYALVIVEML
jgi:hypothetical protein